MPRVQREDWADLVAIGARIRYAHVLNVSTHDPILPRPISLTPDQADPLATEWLLTNSIGGFAMGTMLGVPTRRYHGLLVAAMRPPVARVVALHSMDERVTIDRGSASERVVNLTRFHFEGLRDRPRVHPNLVTFERGPACVWRYTLDGVQIEKRLHLSHGRNAVEIRYTLRAPGRRVRLQLRPLVALRDFHSLRRRAGGVPTEAVFQCRPVGMGVVVVCEHMGVVITSDAPRFRDDHAWWEGLRYEREQDRGQDFLEDLYTPGEFVLDSQGLDHEVSATVYATVDAKPAETPDADTRTRSTRLRAMADACVAQSGGRPVSPADRAAIEHLCAAGDEFVVPRGGSASDAYGHPGLTILAGYPWFADWGRDAMICVPGLLITTGRHDDARAVLHTFARHRRQGIIPNRFDDFGGAPHYNTADASLWFIHAVHELWRATTTIDTELLDACVDILAAYRDGTRAGEQLPATSESTASSTPHAAFSTDATPETTRHHTGGDLSDAPSGPIYMDPADALIVAGDTHTQLTWMDARRDGISFTPRAGKAVEINALWHHALRATAAMLRASENRPTPGALVAARSDHAKTPNAPGANATRAIDADSLDTLADRVAAAFRLLFWNPTTSSLYDLVPDPTMPLKGQPASQLRPNQVFAVSLEYSPLTPKQRDSVLDTVRRRLLTPAGLRTLDPSDPAFHPKYAGPLRQRDEAYHQGTVWPWLLGPYVEATLRAGGFSAESRRAARSLLEPLLQQMTRHCPGHLAEIYDGDTGLSRATQPRPDGCPAQAWSVAMTLRSLVMTL